MKDKLLKKILKLEARKAELSAKGEATEVIAELRSINNELAQINLDIAEFRGMVEEIEAEEGDGENGDPIIEDGAPEKRAAGQAMIVGSFGGGSDSEQRKVLTVALEKRGATLKDNKTVTISFNESPEERAVTVSSDTLVVAKHYSNTLNPTFLEVSGLIDKVNAIGLPGGESYTKGFEKEVTEGDYTAEEAEAHDVTPGFGKVEITKTKITAYTEITEEVEKLPNVQYQSLVSNAIRKAIRKKISRQIVVGAGTAGTIVGIFNAPAAVIPGATDVEISEIDADTLDAIVFGYGGDESIEGNAELILSKKDLAAFNAIKTGSEGKKYYKIDLDATGNAGTISSDGSFKVPFTINSACPVLSAAATVADTLCMAYGKLQAYEMPVFAPVDVVMSTDYKFKEGNIAFKGSTMVGGNTAMYKGFVRVKKVAV